MRQRHVVTLLVFLMAAGLLGGVLWRLQGPDSEQEGEGGSAVADSVSEAVRSEAARSAFSTGMAVPVEGALVRRDTFVLWIEAEGTAEARRRATVRAEVGGPVVELPVREGGRVGEGELLARIDSTSYALDVRKSRAAYEEAMANFRSRMLGTGEMDLTEEERRERRRQARVRSGVAQAEVDLEKARYELSKTRITAPFPGRVANLGVSRGARLDAGDSVATVLDLSQVEVDVDVLQERVPHLAPGRRARVRFTALPGDTFPGRVATINPLVDEASSTVRVTVRLENPEARVLPGMHATVQIAGRRYPDRRFVPRVSVVERQRRDVVFVFAPSDSAPAVGRAKWTYVGTGLENDRFVEIGPEEEGGEAPGAGQVVLVEGHTTLTHDARVRLTNADSLGVGE